MSRFKLEVSKGTNGEDKINVYDFEGKLLALILSPEDARTLASQLYLTIPARKPVDSGV